MIKFLIGTFLLSFLVGENNTIEKKDILRKYKYHLTNDKKVNFLVPVVEKKSETGRRMDFGRKISFNGNCSFVDERNASCGNDIFWTLKGKYTLKENVLTLKYKGGDFMDNTGYGEPATYQNTKIQYNIEFKGDTLYLNHVSGEDFLVRED